MGVVTTRLFLGRVFRTRILKITALLLLFIVFIDVLQIYHAILDSENSSKLLVAHRRNRRQQQRIYIAGMHYNSGELLKSHWNYALISLTETLGTNNVFVSISESGSWDDTKEMLRKLDLELARLGVKRRIELRYDTHQDEMRHGLEKGEVVETRDGLKVRRIPYLARLRNKTIQDLVALHEKGISFDKVLFLNDVVFTVDDVLTLLDTNGGEYAAACSLDFKNPPAYYDTFALRDDNGRPHVMQTWPYFGAGNSRNAMVKNMDAVPVTSCWNGIVAMPTEPFVSSTQLRFRGLADSLASHHLEASECCLIHADNPLSKSLGVYVNPRVRVGYNPKAYEATHPDGSWVSPWSVFRGIWVNRIQGVFRSLVERGIIHMRVMGRIKRWEQEKLGNHEGGDFCIINEMQVLVHNGWAHL